MKNKRWLFVFAVIAALVLVNAGAEAEEETYNKHVSVVFDDSGSMAFDVRWAHANYALQTLVSVLNEGDILNIHYMNDSVKDIAVVIEKGQTMEAILEQIRLNSVPDLLGEGETPVGSISIGLSKFADTQFVLGAPGATYDNWLVLITDGNEMKGADGEGYVNYVEDSNSSSGYRWTGILDRKIASILNSSSLEFSTVILKIGDSQQDMELDNLVSSPVIYKSASVSDEFINDKQIIENMNDIASLISGRFPIAITGKFGKELKINSEVPFNEFDILLQNSNSQVVEVMTADGEQVPFEVEITNLLSPDNQVIGSRNLASDTNLFGSAIRITTESEVALPSGEYTIVFSESIEASKVTSYCLPFIQFDFKYYVNGLEVEKVFQEDMVSLEFIPLRGGTDEVLENLPDEIQYDLKLKSGDNFISFEEDSLQTKEFLIRDHQLVGSLVAEIPDIWLWSLNVSESIPLAPEEERPEDRIFTLDIPIKDASVTYQDFEQAPEVLFLPKLNGEALSADDMDKAELSILRVTSAEGNLTTLDYSLEKEGNAFVFKPVYVGFKPALPSDTYKIEVRFSSNAIENVNEYVFGEITYTVGDASFFIRYLSYIMIVLLSVLIGAYFIGFAVKAKLKEKKYHLVRHCYDSVIDLDVPRKTEYYKIKVNPASRFIIPYLREKGTVGEFGIMAGRKSEHIYLKKETQKIGMVVGQFELKAGTVGTRDLRLNVNQKVEHIVDGKLQVYIYQEIRGDVDYTSISSQSKKSKKKVQNKGKKTKGQDVEEHIVEEQITESNEKSE